MLSPRFFEFLGILPNTGIERIAECFAGQAIQYNKTVPLPRSAVKVAIADEQICRCGSEDARTLALAPRTEQKNIQALHSYFF